MRVSSKSGYNKAKKAAPRAEGDKPSYGMKPAGKPGDKPSYGSKPSHGKPGEKPAYGSKPSHGKPGDKPAYGKSGDRPAYGSKPAYGTKPAAKTGEGRYTKPAPRFSEDRYATKPQGRYENERKASDYLEFDEDDNYNLIEGRNPVLEALKSGREIDKLFIQKGETEGSIRQIVAMARDKNIIIKEVDKLKLDGMSSTRSHQGVIASAALYKYYELNEVLEIAREKEEDPFIIILDEITDNHNLGSIIRTAEAAGVHGIVIPKRRSAGITPIVAKVSAGAVEYMPIIKATNLARVIDQLKKENVWVIGADMKGESCFEKDLTGPVAIVIGSEGEGLGHLITEKCDYTVSIPMKGKISSLNAGVSAAVLTYEVVRQRGLKK